MYETPTLKLVWLTVNRGCNFRCEWCYAAGSKYRAEDEMPLELALELLNISGQLGIKRLFLIGGEPTLWAHLLRFNDAMRFLGMQSTLVTNTLRLADDEYWQAYLAHPNTHIGVSFKAYDRDNLIQNTKAGCFDKVTKGLKRVLAHQTKSIVSFVYSRPYVSHFLDMVKYAVDCGAFGVSVNFCSPAIHKDSVDSRFMVDIEVLVNEVVESYDTAHRLTHGRLVFVMKHPLCIWPRNFIRQLMARGQISTTCHLQHQSGAIFDTDGSLFLCNSMFDFPVGKIGSNFRSAESLATYFGSEYMKGCFAKATNLPSLKCAECEMYSDCAGGCPLMWTVYQPDDVIQGW